MLFRPIGDTKYISCHTENQAGIRCPQFEDVLCYSYLSSDFVRVKEITSSSFGKVQFNYETPANPDGSLRDIEGMDGVLSSIVLTDGNNRQVKKVKLSYQIHGEGEASRPFLVKVAEYGKTETAPKEHQFSYKDLHLLPSRLSFSQDHFGYFNGKDNSDLVPLPNNPQDRALFNNKGGDREPDAHFSTIGMLTQVIYPTGGRSEIVYEANDINVTEDVLSPPVRINLVAEGTDEAFETYDPVVESADPIDVTVEQQVELNLFFENTNGVNDEDHHIMMVATLTDNTMNYEDVSEVLRPGESRKVITSLFEGRSYTLRIEVTGYSGYLGRANFSYVPSKSDNVTYNKEFSGVRVEKIITYDSVDPTPEVKTFHYRYLDSSTVSSGVILPSPNVYHSRRRSAIHCNYGGMSETQIYYCDYKVLHSNSLTLDYLLAPNPVLYESVLVSLGEGFEGGGTEYRFDVQQESPSYTLTGVGIDDAPYDVRGFDNGLLLNENSFKLVDGEVVFSRKVENFYKVDERVQVQVQGVFARKNFHMPRVYSPPKDYDFIPFDVAVYDINTRWKYIYKTVITDFDLNGQNPITRTTHYYYDNPQHALQTRTTIMDSKGDQVEVKKKYPQDIVATGTEEAARQGLINNYQLASVIEESMNHNGTVQKKHTVFKEFFTGKYFPESVRTNTGMNNSMEDRLLFKKYDNNGNLIEVSRADDIPVVYLWGYKHTQPIAEIKNATYEEVEAALGGPTSVDEMSSNTELSQYHLDQLNNLRNQFPKAMVTVYTYDPLVGLTSSTDPNGKTTYYEYDGFGRLRAVKDHEGNVVQSHEYHYAGQ